MFSASGSSAAQVEEPKQRTCLVCRQLLTPEPRCPTCRLVHSLDHPHLLLANSEVDPPQLMRAAHALRASPPYPDLHLDLAVIYANLGWLEEAASHCQAALRTRANDERTRTLLRAIERAIGAGDQLPLAPVAKSAPVLDVLVIDDSHTVLRAVTMMLTPHGYRVRSAATPFEALGLLNDTPPDLVILDLTLPQMDGFKLAKVIHDHPKTAQVPIVMLTSRDGLIDRLRSRMVGAVAFVHKPFTQAELLDVVRRHGDRR